MDYVKKIKTLIADKAGLEISEVTPDQYFEDDLNLGEMEVRDILEELEEALDIELIEEKDNIETVNDLIELVREQVE